MAQLIFNLVLGDIMHVDFLTELYLRGRGEFSIEADERHEQKLKHMNEFKAVYRTYLQDILTKKGAKCHIKRNWTR